MNAAPSFSTSTISVVISNTPSDDENDDTHHLAQIFRFDDCVQPPPIDSEEEEDTERK